MLKNIVLLLIGLMFLNLSCGYNSNITGEQNYIEPAQLNHPRLMYPRSAQENSLTGEAKMLFDINKDGKVSNVSITQSTGSNILDNSAKEYCNSLIFEPAKINGNPIKIRMSIAVKFEISNMDMLGNIYVNNVNRLYNVLNSYGTFDRLSIEREILHDHINFVHNMRDALNFNSYAALVISNKITQEWKDDWDSWPLSFLIFYDFIQRYPDYDSLQYVKHLMYSAAKYDVDYIENSHDSDIKSEQLRENLISRIKGFIKIHNRDSQLNNPESNGIIEDRHLSFNIEN